jgi:hypothetical protein
MGFATRKIFEKVRLRHPSGCATLYVKRAPLGSAEVIPSCRTTVHFTGYQLRGGRDDDDDDINLRPRDLPKGIGTC